MREAACHAGVSPGAPFRHFPSRDALMAVVAAEAQRRFRAEIDAALAEAPAADPLARFRALGLAYLRWAMRNPAHFEIISSGRYFDHDRAAGLSRTTTSSSRASPGIRGWPEFAAQAALRLGIHPASRRLRQIHCAFMTFHLHFHDTSQVPAAPSVSWSSPAKAQRQCRV
ncbi:TetR/AcrR family transcriptional regulator [Bradyrhizobium sediminis]|uniref:TetR/AcrR family transcriptional regulator n=1 Tax=Bradyrhizobium sediminis TaxID=2840469 RepID=UPI00201C16A0|nr:TetR/AcrR family transcriptional regulator [Bradyrhizobium sediminis]